MAEETIRKNVSISGMYAKIYKDLERTSEFEHRFGGFSQFVQEMIARLHENPEKVEAEIYREKAKHFEEKAKALEEELETKEEAEEVTEDDRDWLEEKFNFLKKKSRSEGSIQKAFEKRQDNLVSKYSREFSRINPRTLRRKLQEVGNDNGHDVELTA